MKERKIAILGLGYVGLPVALAMAKKFSGTVGFDINSTKVSDLKNGKDVTEQFTKDELKSSSIVYTDKKEDLKQSDFFIVAVPTPVDNLKKPDLTPVVKASETVGSVLKKGDIVVYESTVYPGVTEEICGPILEKISGLKQGKDFFLGYSPERINPGDTEHTFEKIKKVVSGENPEILEIVGSVYASVVTAGVHKAPTIKVAEAAKVIENTQRDINIALMNELSLIFDRMGIRTKDVLEAAGTKWNFLKFSPGLVGGHCIGVDPYYLTSKAEELGYNPQVILSGRRINDGMGAHIAQKCVKLLINNGLQVKGAKAAILGITFKENVPDIRNSKVPDIITELKEFGVHCDIFDPYADLEETRHEYGLTVQQEIKGQYDVVIFAVSHNAYLEKGSSWIKEILKPKAVFIDVKSVYRVDDFAGYTYWSL